MSRQYSINWNMVKHLTTCRELQFWRIWNAQCTKLLPQVEWKADWLNTILITLQNTPKYIADKILNRQMSIYRILKMNNQSHLHYWLVLCLILLHRENPVCGCDFHVLSTDSGIWTSRCSADMQNVSSCVYVSSVVTLRNNCCNNSSNHIWSACTSLQNRKTQTQWQSMEFLYYLI